MKILLIGLGRHGMRHAESLIKSDSTIIHIVEPINLKEKLEKIQNQNLKNENVYGYPDLRGFLEKHIHADLIIIATDSKVRFELLHLCINAGISQNFILEKLIAANLQSLEQYKNYLFQKDLKIYVNCPQRTYPFYSQLLNNNEEIIAAKYYGFKHIGLGTNLLHYVDLIEYLTGQTINSGSGEKLHTWIESKRAGFSEYLGEVQVKIGDVELKFTAYDEDRPLASLYIETNLHKYHLDEIANVAYRDNVLFAENFMLNQSDITLSLCKEVINGKSKLPELSQSIRQHEKIFCILQERHYQLSCDLEFAVS